MNSEPIEMLSSVLAQAETARDSALGALREADDQARGSHHQAQQLEQYRTEYQQRWAAQFALQGAIEIVQCYRSFMDRLDQALTQQRQACVYADARAARARDELVERERRVASVRKMIERKLEAQRLLNQRLEQKQTDEAGQRAAWARRGTSALNAVHH